MIRHVIWDFDGTLIDSYPPMTRAFMQALSEAGIVEPYDSVLSIMKQSAGALYEHVRQRYGLADDFLARYRDLKDTAERETMRPFPQAAAVCAAIRASGRTNDLYTHRGASAIAHLTRFGMIGDFRGFITGEDPFPRKPAPDALLHLATRYGMNPEEAVMVGDRDIDLLAGRNAGMRTCLFDPDPAATSPHADFHITRLSELPAMLERG